jgi:hypothetical protein
VLTVIFVVLKLLGYLLMPWWAIVIALLLDAFMYESEERVARDAYEKGKAEGRSSVEKARAEDDDGWLEPHSF